MILSNREIYAALDDGRIVIRPEPKPRLDEPGRQSPFDTHSVDVRLAANLSIPKPGPYTFDLDGPGGGLRFPELVARLSDQRVIGPDGYALPPNQFVLGKTVEYVALPIGHPKNVEHGVCFAARFEGKSSRARTGLLVHFTAPTIHPGFEGTITLEIINLGPVPFLLRPNMPIGQLIFEEVRGLPVEKASQFQGQTTPEGH
jgi:dCTP deaminase